MSKAFLIDAYFWSPDNREYKFSHPSYPDGEDRVLSMTYVTCKNVEKIEHHGGIASIYDVTYYLYKLEVNAKVVIDDDSFFFHLGFVTDDGFLPHRYCRAYTEETQAMLSEREENTFDHLIDTEGYVVMRSSWYMTSSGNGWCLFRFKSPLVIADNV